MLFEVISKACRNWSSKPSDEARNRIYTLRGIALEEKERGTKHAVRSHACQTPV